MADEYVEQFTVFIDFLGIKEASKKIDDQARQHLLELLVKIATLRSNSKYFRTQGLLGNAVTIRPAISTFSDNLVISYNINEIKLINDGNTNAYFIWPSLIKMISLIASQALGIGFLIRGGATIGKLYHSQGVIFGEALVDSYKIESSISKYPRIVISNEIVNNHDFMEHKSMWLFKDMDGLYCIDYFFSMLWESGIVGVGSRYPSKEWFDKAVNMMNLKLNELSKSGKQTEYSNWHWFAKNFKLGLQRVPKDLLGDMRIEVDTLPW